MTSPRSVFAAGAVIVGVMVLLVLGTVDRSIRTAFSRRAVENATAAAQLAAHAWNSGTEAAVVVRQVQDATNCLVTLLDHQGLPVAGGSGGQDPAVVFPALPEVLAAMQDGVGVSRSDGGQGPAAVAVAVRTPQGVVRVVSDPAPPAQLVVAVRRYLLLAALAGLVLAAVAAAWISARSRRPLRELRDITLALASGDLSRRPALVTPGETGDLASAIYRLSEQLTGQVHALRSEESLLLATMEALNEWVVAIDNRRQVVRINHTARNLLAAFEPVPFPVERLPRVRALREALDAALAGNSTDGLEVSVLDLTLAISARPLPDGGAVLAAYDLTRQRKLETVRRDFVANVSHELKTPLTIVSGFAETLTDGDAPAAMRMQFAESIRSNARRMQRIVDDLLDLSRIESGGWRPRAATIPIETAAAEVFALAQGHADRTGVSLRTDVPADAGSVYADPTALRQILVNLVDNGIRYAGQGTVTVYSRRVPSGIVVGVRDTGTGISAEHLPRIFERFYRVDAARSREEGGTGLGLAIVKHLVEAHGGRLVAESRVGSGTDISASFPAPAS